MVQSWVVLRLAEMDALPSPKNLVILLLWSLCRCRVAVFLELIDPSTKARNPLDHFALVDRFADLIDSIRIPASIAEDSSREHWLRILCMSPS